MKVIELIKELQQCQPDDIVMYDYENSFTNEANCSMYPEKYSDLEKALDENGFSMGIDDVEIGTGTLKGFVFLTEDLMEGNE